MSLCGGTICFFLYSLKCFMSLYYNWNISEHKVKVYEVLSSYCLRKVVSHRSEPSSIACVRWRLQPVPSELSVPADSGPVLQWGLPPPASCCHPPAALGIRESAAACSPRPQPGMDNSDICRRPSCSLWPGHSQCLTKCPLVELPVCSSTSETSETAQVSSV